MGCHGSTEGPGGTGRSLKSLSQLISSFTKKQIVSEEPRRENPIPNPDLEVGVQLERNFGYSFRVQAVPPGQGIRPTVFRSRDVVAFAFLGNTKSRRDQAKTQGDNLDIYNFIIFVL